MLLPSLNLSESGAAQLHFASNSQSICIISDLHLCDESDAEHDGPATRQAFVSFINALSKDAQCSMLIVLGDLFEVWVGDDAATTKASRAVIKSFRQMHVAGKAVLLMHGNRDFLLGESFSHASQCTLVRNNALVVHYQNHRIALVHGDEQCTDDLAYQQFRAMVRKPEWQAEFLRKPLSERQAVARAIRNVSELNKRSESEHNKSQQGYTNVNTQAALALMQTLLCPTLIHGHTHEGKSHQVRGLADWPDAQRHVTKDWDARSKRGDALWITPHGIERRKIF
jgi:UDP-2,3-diacylglucosamine hydrolase